MHIWIGDLAPPTEWMDTWRRFHPDWKYDVIDNAFIASRRFQNQSLIDWYMRSMQFAGAADLIRYELLFESGGFIAEADSVCMRNTDELWTRPCAYTVYENEFLRGKLVSPILASNPKNPFVGDLIDQLGNLQPDEIGSPWMTTGNLFVAQMIETRNPDIEIFPSHFFIPVHYSGVKYEGKGPVYAHQLFGSTRKAYGKPNMRGHIRRLWGKYRRLKAKKNTQSRIEKVIFEVRHGLLK